MTGSMVDIFSSLHAQRAPRLTSSEEIADILRENITNGTLTPGTRLQEEALTASLGVARNTLRESFRTLVHERLLIHEINRGVFVIVPTPQDVRDVYQFRKLLECNAIRSVRRDADLTELADSVSDASAVIARDDWIGAGTANIRFHRAIMALAESPRQNAAMRTLLAETRLHVSSFDPRSWHEPFAPRNRAIYEAIAAGKNDEAATLMEQMLDRASELIAAAHEQSPTA
jgi:DNA-binding GntR family transcriptional regulator